MYNSYWRKQEKEYKAKDKGAKGEIQFNEKAFLHNRSDKRKWPDW